jgi:uncharacterized protein RhaS with RHS repeats
VNYEYDAQGNPTRTIQAPTVPGLNLTVQSRVIISLFAVGRCSKPEPFCVV